MTLVVPGFDRGPSRRRTNPPPATDAPVSAGRTLIGAKLRPPELRPGTVHRRAILETLRRSSSQTVVSVIAPPGYGKTSALAQWAAAVKDGGHAVGWLRLDELDNDPSLLVAYLGAAFDPTAPRNADVGMAGHARGAGVRRETALLAARLDEAAAPAVLILDDIHRLTSRAALDVVERIIDRLPRGTRIALAGRTEPDLP